MKEYPVGKTKTNIDEKKVSESIFCWWKRTLWWRCYRMYGQWCTTLMWIGDLNFRKLYAELMSETPQKIKLESVPILVAIFDIWNSNVLTCSPHIFHGFQILTNFPLIKKQFYLLNNLGLGNRGKGGFIWFFSEQAQIQSIFIHFIFQSLVKVSSCTFDIIGWNLLAEAVLSNCACSFKENSLFKFGRMLTSIFFLLTAGIQF